MTDLEKRKLLALGKAQHVVRNEIVMRERVLKNPNERMRKVEEMSFVLALLKSEETATLAAAKKRLERHLVRRDLICGLGQAADHVHTVKQGNTISWEAYDFILMMLHEAQNYLVQEQDDERENTLPRVPKTDPAGGAAR